MAGPAMGRSFFLWSAAVARAIEMVFGNLAAKRIAVDSEDLGGAALVSIRVFEHAPDEFFLEFRAGFLEQDAALDHHSDQRFQLLFHVCTLRSSAGIFPHL